MNEKELADIKAALLADSEDRWTRARWLGELIAEVERLQSELHKKFVESAKASQLNAPPMMDTGQSCAWESLPGKDGDQCATHKRSRYHCQAAEIARLAKRWGADNNFNEQTIVGLEGDVERLREALVVERAYLYYIGKGAPDLTPPLDAVKEPSHPDHMAFQYALAQARAEVEKEGKL